MRLIEYQWLQSPLGWLVGTGERARTVYHAGYRAGICGPSGMQGLQDHYFKTQNCLFKWMSCSPGGPILCFQPENLPGQHPFTRFWKKYSEFSWEAAPPPLSDHITWVKLDSTSCSRVGHPRRLRSSSHCDWLKMRMGLNYCGGDSVLGNSWKKRNFP